MNRNQSALSAISILLLFAAACSRLNLPTRQTPLRIGMVTFAGYAPLYLAKEKSLFPDVDVTLQRIEEIPSLRAAIARKDLDAYLATPDIAEDTNTAPPGRAVWAIDESAGGDGVIVGPDSAATISALKGKDVAAEPGLPPNFLLLYFLYKNDMSLKDVRFKDMTTQNAATAFVSGSVDAAGIYEPYLSQAKQKRAGSKIVLSSKDLPGVIVDLVFVREDLVSSGDSRIDGLIVGWRRAIDLIHTQPDVAYPIMAKAFGLSVSQFRETVGGIRWLDLADNRQIFGTSGAPGPLFSAFKEVGSVLRKNRAEVFGSDPDVYLVRDYIDKAH